MKRWLLAVVVLVVAIAVTVGIFTGRIEAVTQAAIDMAKLSVTVESNSASIKLPARDTKRLSVACLVSSNSIP